MFVFVIVRSYSSCQYPIFHIIEQTTLEAYQPLYVPRNGIQKCVVQLIFIFSKLCQLVFYTSLASAKV